MKRAPNQPFSELCLFGGVYIRTWVVADRGTLLPQHAHQFDHVSYIVSGVVRAWRGGELMGDFAGPNALKIEAGVLHQFLTLTDRCVIACVHNADRAEADDEPAIAEHAQLELED